MAIKKKSRHVVSIYEGQKEDAGSQTVILEGARQGLTPKGLRNPIGLRQQIIGHGGQAGASLSGQEAAD